MGHRANFVLIENGKAKAYSDQWAALACTLSLEEGAGKLKKMVPRLYEPTTELMEWAFAEGGFLIDYDERRCIAFGYPDVDLSEMPDDYAKEMRPVLDALDEGFPSFVALIAKGWRGFTMAWDNRGVDAFAEHLARRGIASIATQRPSAPASVKRERPVEVIVDVSVEKKPRAKAGAKAKAKARAKPKPKPKPKRPAAKTKAKAGTKRRARARAPAARARRRPARHR